MGGRKRRDAGGQFEVWCTVKFLVCVAWLLEEIDRLRWHLN